MIRLGPLAMTNLYTFGHWACVVALAMKINQDKSARRATCPVLSNAGLSLVPRRLCR